MNFTNKHAFDLPKRYSVIKEVGGTVDNPTILAMLRLDNEWPQNDEVPWCSGFMNHICWLARLPRSKSLMARSWLTVGKGITLEQAEPGDVIILKRGTGEQPGPEVLKAPGHVGFYAGRFGEFIEVLGGNQSDTVKISRYPVKRLLGVRRLE